jgi:hypothetical protein
MLEDEEERRVPLGFNPSRSSLFITFCGRDVICLEIEQQEVFIVLLHV